MQFSPIPHIFNSQHCRIRPHRKQNAQVQTWIFKAAEFCCRIHNRRLRSNLVCSKSFCLSLSFVLRPPKSTRFRVDESPEKNILPRRVRQFQSNPRRRGLVVLLGLTLQKAGFRACECLSGWIEWK